MKRIIWDNYNNFRVVIIGLISNPNLKNEIQVFIGLEQKKNKPGNGSGTFFLSENNGFKKNVNIRPSGGPVRPRNPRGGLFPDARSFLRPP